MPSTRVRPIEKFAKAASKCSAEVCSCSPCCLYCRCLISPQAATYGKCIVADYNAVHKDMCAKEFMKLKDCFLVCCLEPMVDAAY